MSILIKGMDMPKEGSFSILYVYGDGSIRMPAWGKGLVKAEYMQASELPPHGRLIDADALLDALQKLFEEREKDARFSGNKGVFIGWNDAIFKIKTAPTIIEAEEEEK